MVIGNFGAYLHGVNVQTQDADMAYQRTKDNHNRLLAALEEMDADIRHGESTARLPTNVPNLLEQSTMWNLRTIYGDLDMLYNPLGGGYDYLLLNAVRVDIGQYPALVASWTTS